MDISFEPIRDLYSKNNLMTTIKIMSDYHCSPIWIKSPGGFFENVPVDILEVNENFKSRILEWDSIYQSTLDMDNPSKSDFPSQKDREDFEKIGLELYKELGDLLSKNYVLLYYSVIHHKVLKENY